MKHQVLLRWAELESECPRSGKVVFGTRIQAQACATELRLRVLDAELLRPYPCVYAGHWHLVKDRGRG